MTNTTTDTGFRGQWFLGGGNRPGVLAAFMLCATVGHDGFAQQAASRLQEQTTTVAATKHFEFHSDPWINLHHFLYQWAREDAGLGTGRRHVPVPERSSIVGLSTEERGTWLRAVEFYRDSVAAHGHWDPEMLQLKRKLLNLSGDPLARPPDEIKGIGAALSMAMPVYRDRWWPQHDKANRKWIAGVVPRLRNHEQRYVQMTIRVYGAAWPEARWRVDVSAYANPRAGYTTTEGHIVIYSTDPGNQDLYGLETLFHEIQHASAVGGSISDDLARAFKVAGTRLSENLWHALIFATAGEFTQSVARSEGLPVHTPYWIKEGFESLEGWSTLVPVVRQHWLPVVRGEASKEQGLAALARAFS
jgi:hypothetical protein